MDKAEMVWTLSATGIWRHERLSEGKFTGGGRLKVKGKAFWEGRTNEQNQCVLETRSNLTRATVPEVWSTHQ